MCNTYPNRRKNPIVFDSSDAYLDNLTEQEAVYVETINKYMTQALEALTDLEIYITLK